MKTQRVWIAVRPGEEEAAQRARARRDESGRWWIWSASPAHALAHWERLRQEHKTRARAARAGSNLEDEGTTTEPAANAVGHPRRLDATSEPGQGRDIHPFRSRSTTRSKAARQRIEPGPGWRTLGDALAAIAEKAPTRPSRPAHEPMDDNGRGATPVEGVRAGGGSPASGSYGDEASPSVPAALSAANESERRTALLAKIARLAAGQ